MNRKCPVCGEAATDGVDDQVAIWGLGVHNAKTNQLKVVKNSKLDNCEILHKECLNLYIEGFLIELNRRIGT